ncbi:MAG: biotin--[acetyl-CoA-carboxylase] ligase [Thermoleophilia bacterium]|nr:biotin--[acetyl-CoA-carboxylase] ligase [Thermoleophilia bacterium]
MQIGEPHLHFRTVGSTNTEARELAEAGAPSGTLVTSDEQTAGRGRQGRPWSTPAGAALAYSFILHREVRPPSTLPLQIGVAVCEAVEALGVDRAALKWPNDVWIDGLKCAGILVESRPQDGWAVAGIGLNLTVGRDEFPPELKGRATSVGHGAGAASATAALNEAIGRRLEIPFEETLDELSSRDALRGRTIGWDRGSGVAAGFDREGNLLIEGPAGHLTTLNTGEVHLEI